MTAPRIVEEEAWRARAACAEVGPDVFYPPPPGWDNEERGYDEARLVCKRCPVEAVGLHLRAQHKGRLRHVGRHHATRTTEDQESVMRRCSRCHVEKPLDKFAKEHAYCRACASEYNRELRLSRPKLPPDDPRHGQAATYTNHRCRCGPCKAAKAAASKASRAARRVTEVCPICRRSFTAGQAFRRHVAAHESRVEAQRRQGASLDSSKRKVANKKLQHFPTVAEIEEPKVWGPDPASWARPGPGMVVLEVIEELSDDEVEALLAGFRPLGGGEATASEMARLDLMFGAKGGHR